METLFQGVERVLDFGRSRVLRLTLSTGFAQNVFRHRAARLGGLCLLFFAASLPLSCRFPLLVLAIGPLVYGFPHLFATVRYVSRALAPREWGIDRTILYLFLVSLGLVGAIHVFCDAGLVPELAFLAINLAALAWMSKRSWKTVGLAGILLGPLAFFAFWSPWYLTGVLLLAHHFIAFVYWLNSAKSRSEKWVAAAALSLFSVTNALLLLGHFDPWLAPAAGPAWSGMDIESLGRGIAPLSENPMTWLRLVVAYAFGQSTHYLVWLKVIPDQEHDHETPTTFRQSRRLLERDFGKYLAWTILALLAVSLGFWALVEYPQARLLYLAAASYHGFIEIAGLAVLAATGLLSARSRIPTRALR